MAYTREILQKTIDYKIKDLKSGEERGRLGIVTHSNGNISYVAEKVITSGNYRAEVFYKEEMALAYIMMENWKLCEIDRLRSWHGDKAERLLEAMQDGKVKRATYWDDCRKLVKRVRSDNALKEWEILFESMEKILKEKRRK